MKVHRKMGRSLKQWTVGIAVLLTVGAGIYSCSKPTETGVSYTVTVTGKVVKKNYNPLDSVTIITEIPFRRDTIKSSDGTFSYSFSTDDKNAVTTKITFSRPRFRDTTFSETYSSGSKSIDFGVVIMSAYNPVEDTSTVVQTSSLRPVSIVFVGASQNYISIAGSGGTETASLTFEARDSVGMPINLSSQVSMGFRFISRPDLLTLFNRDTIGTNAQGQATVILQAGQKAGIVQVQAYAAVKKPNGTTDSIKSSIFSLPIYGGMADSAHFSLGTTKYNIPGAVKFNLRAPITAILGDKFGNPAQPGTVVYFTTTGGIIQPSASSTPDGQAQVDLITGNPVPQNGIATITAQIATGGVNGSVGTTGLSRLALGKDAALEKSNIPQPLKAYVTESVNESGPVKKTQSIFTRSFTMLLSGATIVSTADTNFVITTGSEKKIDFFVGDANGNPLAEGTEIKVSGAGLDTSGVALTGDVDKTIPDTQDKSYTHFSVLLTDKRTTNLNVAKRVTLNFEVTSPNGNTKLSISGTLPPAGADSGKVGLADSTHFTVFSDKANYPWNGANGQPIGSVVAQLGDKNGNPVKLSPVTFTTNAGRITGSVQTDINGRAEATLLGGLPLPPGGIGTVTISTLGTGSVTITKSVSFLYTVAPMLALSTPADTNFVMTPGSTKRVDFSVSDMNLNPLSSGTTIRVNGTGLDTAGLALAGDVDRLLPDTQDKSFTHFSITLTDKGTRTLNVGRFFTLNFDVNSPSGALKKSISGYLPPVSSDSGKTGLADTAHFTVFTDKSNYPWYGQSGQPIGSVVIQLGDKNGNPVVNAPVTLVTNAGRVTGSVQTDVNGRAQASLLGGLPLPPGGIGTVTVSALGTGGATISKSVNFYYTGSPILAFPGLARDTLAAIVDGGYIDVPFTLADNNGNPIAAGNTVTVTTTGTAASDVVLSQDFNFITDGVRKTFQFRASDKTPGAGLDGTVNFTVTVNGITGSVVRTLNGSLLGPNNISVPPSVRQPAKIAWIGTSATDIYVSGVGALENSVVTYEVQDSLGQPIDKSKRVYATYTLQFFPNSSIGGGTSPRVIPGADSTNDQGRLQASIISGTQSGTIQIVVNVIANGSMITSQPVKITIHSGFPDQDHFSIMPDLFTVLRGDMTHEHFTVAVGDTFSNPVAIGTAVYFHSQAGIVATGSDNFNAYTDKNSLATVPFLMVRPYADVLPYYYVPPPGSLYDAPIGGRMGYFWVYAQTQGRFNKQVIDSVLILESVLPANLINVPNTVVPVPSGGQSAPITITVYDIHGNPLPAGTKITVTADYPQTADGNLKFGIAGAANVTIPNDAAARFRGPGITDFTFWVVDQTVGGALSGQSLIVHFKVDVDGTHTYETAFSARVP